MDGMIQDLLDSVKFQTGERLHLRLEEFDIQEVVKEVCDNSRLCMARAFKSLVPRQRLVGPGGNQKGN